MNCLIAVLLPGHHANAGTPATPPTETDRWTSTSEIPPCSSL